MPNYSNIEFLKCKVCGLQVWIGEEYLEYYCTSFNSKWKWKKLDLSCEEMIIKGLLE